MNTLPKDRIDMKRFQSIGILDGFDRVISPYANSTATFPLETIGKGSNWLNKTQALEAKPPLNTHD
jgi:hypothetical protein